MNNHRQPIIDVHCHCFTGPGQAEAVTRGLQRLRRQGLELMAVMGMVNTQFSAEAARTLIPDFVVNYGDPQFNEVATLLDYSRQSDGTLFPMVDTRHLSGDVARLLQGYQQQGFRGIKGIYLADEGNNLGVGSIPTTFGISLQQYHRREWQIFAFAETHGMPLLYHMDARNYGDVMRAMLDDFPQLRVNFAHFGIGRSAFGKILDRYPRVYTDLASMLPHVRSNPASYRDFIIHYQDRVCFGSDAFLYQPEIVVDYIEMVRSLKLPAEVEAKVFSTNPRNFLGLT